MRYAAILTVSGIVMALVLVGGCGQPPAEEPTVQAPPPDPGWPDIKPEQAVAQYCLQEAHHHLERARLLSPTTFGNSEELRLAWGYTGAALNILPERVEVEEEEAPALRVGPAGGAPQAAPGAAPGPGMGPGAQPGMGPGPGRGM